MIEQAIAEGEALAKESLHLQELAVAQLTAFYFNSQKAKPPYGKVEDFCFFKERTMHPPEVYIAFQSLLQEQKVPSWSVSILPASEMEATKVIGKPPKIRLFSAPGIFILAPKIDGKYIESPMAAFDDDVIKGCYTRVYNIDDVSESYQIWIPNDLENLMLDSLFSYR